MTPPRTIFLAGCMILLLAGAVGFLIGPGAPLLILLLGGERKTKAVGGGWEAESISNRAGGDSMFQRRLLRSGGSILVEPDVRDLAYCGDDCVLYKTSSQRDWIHYRSACGNKRPALFVAPVHSIWQMKGCELFDTEFTDGGEVYVPLFSTKEIKRRAMEQPVAKLERTWFRRKYVGNSKDAEGGY